MEPEEYELPIDCPLGTMVGPGRYGMYWVARSHRTCDRPDCVHTVFRSAMPTDFQSMLLRPETHSVAEHDLKWKRGINDDQSRAIHANR